MILHVTSKCSRGGHDLRADLYPEYRLVEIFRKDPSAPTPDDWWNWIEDGVWGEGIESASKLPAEDYRALGEAMEAEVTRVIALEMKTLSPTNPMNSAVLLLREFAFSHLNRRARSEGWEINRRTLTIHRITQPPETCLDPAAWTPPFADDFEARAFVSERAAQDVDQDPGVVIHQNALRVVLETPEAMLLSSAVVRARRAGLAVTGLEVEAALAVARAAAERHPNDNTAWTVAASRASEVLPGFPTIDAIAARLGENLPQDAAAAALLNCLADQVIVERQAKAAAASPAAPTEEATTQEGGEGQEPPPRRQGR